MPGAGAMTAFTPEAEARLEGYLRRVHAALDAAPDIDPAEVEADVRAHVDAEFAGRRGPIGVRELDAVLARLGPPSTWAGGADGRPAGRTVADGVRAVRDGVRQALRGVAAVLWRGPEDWRLAYLTFGAFLLFLFFAPALNRSPAPLLVLFVAYLLGRATLAAARETGVRLGARRWLVYPPLLLVSLPLLVGTLAVPLAGAAAAGKVASEAVDLAKGPERLRAGRARPDPRTLLRVEEDAETARRFLDPLPGPLETKPVAAAVAAGVGAYALWGVLLGGLAWAFPGLPRMVFAPLLSGVGAGHGRRLFTLSAAALVVWAAFAYRYLERAGVA